MSNKGKEFIKPVRICLQFDNLSVLLDSELKTLDRD
jgi:hypothetical protein